MLVKPGILDILVHFAKLHYGINADTSELKPPLDTAVRFNALLIFLKEIQDIRLCDRLGTNLPRQT